MVDSIALIGAGAPLPEGGTNTCISSVFGDQIHWVY